MRKRFCLLLAALILLSLTACHRVREDELRVIVLDVGQGDCILFSQGDTHMLVDTGSSVSRDALVGQLHALGIRRLDYLILTHPDEDHFGNARIVLERCEVDNLIVSDAPEGEGAYRDAFNAARNNGTTLKKVADGCRFSLGDAACSLAKPALPEASENDASLVVRVAFGSTVFLLMGDVEEKGEQALINDHGARFLDCDWIKVGHHGSTNSTGEALLDVATPRYAVISCAAHNEYGFPSEAVLGRLEDRYINVYRTDTMGALYFRSNGEEITYGK